MFLQTGKVIYAKDNTFDCGIGKTSGTCAVHAERCTKNYQSDTSVCSSIDVGDEEGKAACRAKTNIPCISMSKEGDVICDGGTGINTAIGCIHIFNGENSFLSDLLRWATGIGGGIAFALMLYAGFMIMTASGNPERIKAGQELLTSAIAGLILLVLSIVILKFIGVDILGLDKFGFNQ